jgi:hypothetical protein
MHKVALLSRFYCAFIPPLRGLDTNSEVILTIFSTNTPNPWILLNLFQISFDENVM